MRRFRKPKSKEEEANCVGSSVPKNTKYVTKWAVTLFCDWQKARNNKKAEFEETSFNFGDIKTLQDCDTNLEEMGAQSLNFWMIKFVQEVAKKDGDLYPPKTLNSIVCGINRYLEDKNDYNFMDKSDKRFSLLRKVMDAEMKESTKKGFGLKNTKPQREPVTAEEEEILWSKGLLGVVQDKAFYFYPNRDFSKFEFEQRPLGENKLNGILPDELCAKAGLPRKTAHSLRITTATRLFQSGIEEKLIRDRTGHKSDSLFKYERVSNQQLKQASSILGPCNSEANDSTNYPSFEFNLFDTLGDNVFDNVISDETLCSINLSDDDLMFNEDVADEILAGIDYESATTSVTRPTPKVSEACTASPPKLVFSNCTFTNVTFTNSK
ncbi:hypothetical protein AC249_AIPGENE23591 [Exaiptasia diaphana]|nr:hypothetical protein AC249_AIPGENE23591 [Exaiptasia diaphana]